MKKITLGFVFLLLVSVLPLFGQQTMFFETLSKQVRINLSIGYFAAADRYESLGFHERAEACRKMGEELLAPWKDSTINTDQNISIPVDDAMDNDAGGNGNQQTVDDPIREDTYADGDEGPVESGVRSAFNRYKAAFFAEDLDAVMGMTAEPFYIPFDEEGMTKEEVREMYAAIFDQYPVDENDPDAVYRSDSLVINEMENGYYRVDIQTSDTYKDYFFSITFWNSFQSYYFMMGEDGEWLLTAISSTESSF